MQKKPTLLTLLELAEQIVKAELGNAIHLFKYGFIYSYTSFYLWTRLLSRPNTPVNRQTFWYSFELANITSDKEYQVVADLARLHYDQNRN